MLEGNALTALAAIELTGEDRVAATESLGLARASHRETGHRLGEARTLELLGQCDEGEAGRSHRSAAVRLFYELGLNPVPMTSVDGGTFTPTGPAST